MGSTTLFCNENDGTRLKFCIFLKDTTEDKLQILEHVQRAETEEKHVHRVRTFYGSIFSERINHVQPPKGRWFITPSKNVIEKEDIMRLPVCSLCDYSQS
jgi:hypothetical protein